MESPRRHGGASVFENPRINPAYLNDRILVPEAPGDNAASRVPPEVHRKRWPHNGTSCSLVVHRGVLFEPKPQAFG
ncbi:MAG: hypothetical protein KDA96_19500 [Planctomycetaceae bacterium]|nr:hypothetical protein [Planctomycetaceae bacterium]